MLNPTKLTCQRPFYKRGGGGNMLGAGGNTQQCGTHTQTRRHWAAQPGHAQLTQKLIVDEFGYEIASADAQR